MAAIRLDVEATRGIHLAAAARAPLAPPLGPVRALPGDALTLGQRAPWHVSSGNRVRPLVDAAEVGPEVLSTVQGAQKSVLVQMFLLGGDYGMQVAKALVAKHEQGLDVRVLLNPKYAEDGHDDHQAAIDYLTAHHVRLLPYPIGKMPEHEGLIKRSWGVAHAKAVVADGEKAVVGGMNFSDTGMKAHDFMVAVEGPAASQVGNLFNGSWVVSGGERHAPFKPAEKVGGTTIELAESSPTRREIAPLVVQHLRAASTSIDVEALMLDHPAYVEELIKAKQERHVDVRVLLDASAVPYFAGQYPGGKVLGKIPAANLLPNLQAIAKLRAADIPVSLYVPHDGTAYLHAKLAIIDHQTVLLGSANFTTQATDHNLEYMLAFQDEAAAARFEGVFGNDWLDHATPVEQLPGWQKGLARLVGWGFAKLYGPPFPVGNG